MSNYNYNILSAWSIVIYLKMVMASEVGQAINPQPAPRLQPVTKVIVLAYYRGGSSFLAQLINHNSQAMYLFEPFVQQFNQYKVSHGLTNTGDIYVDSNTLELR